MVDFMEEHESTLADALGLDIVRSEVRHQPARRALASQQSAGRDYDDPA
jgi:hypothetical protein